MGLKEPLVSALGGFPFGLKKAVEDDLEVLRKVGIKPVFVFGGCSITRSEKPFAVTDDSPRARSQAWDLYDQGLPLQAVAAFERTGMVPAAGLTRVFMRILDDNDIEFQVAPYAAWPQLVYLEKQGVVDAICGNSELFLFDVEKVIVRLDLMNSSFTHIRRERLRSDTQLPLELFIDACLLAGTQFCRTFPPLENGAQPNHAWNDALNMMKRYRSVGSAINSHPDQQAGYLDKYKRARAAVKHHVILKDDGKAEQMEFSESPGDVHEFIGLRLPEELYFYLSRGMIGPQVIDMLVTGEYIEKAPLDNGDSEEYRKFLDGLGIMRTESLSLLAKSLHKYWIGREVKVYNWFDAKNPRVLVHKDIPHPSELTKTWNVPEKIFMSELIKKEGRFLELSFAITSLDSASFPAQTITPKDPKKPLVTAEEIRVNTLWRMLQIRGFVEEKTHALTPWGRALAAAFKIAGTEIDYLTESLYLAMELFRMKVLKPDNFTPALSGAPSRGSGEDKANTLLVSRVASLLPIDHKPIGYSGPLSRNLLAFNSFVRALTRELRNSAEMTLVNLLMAGDAERDRDDWQALGLKLPFIDEVNCCLGIATKAYLEELCGQSDPTNPEMRKQQKDHLRALFAQAYDVPDDVEMAFSFWDALAEGIRVLQRENIMPDETSTFLAADKWLADRR